MFQIVVLTRNNSDWLQLLLLSLKNTLYNKNRPILIVDGSTPKHKTRLSKVDSCGLNTTIVRDLNDTSTKHTHGSVINGEWVFTFSQAISLTSSPIVCLIDADVIMLKEHWDTYIEDLLRAGHTLIAISPRYHQIAETAFCLTDRETFIACKFAHSYTIEWDENVMKKPHPDSSEHAAISYFDALRGGKPKLFNKSAQIPGLAVHKTRWGQVVLDDKGQEFLYHNYYSSRVDKQDIHITELKYHFNHIVNARENPKILLEYVTKIWPRPIAPFLSANNNIDETEKMRQWLFKD